MSSVDYGRRKAFINALVSDTTLKYREDEKVGAGYTEKNTIIMPTYRPEFTKAQDHHWMMQLLNNTYHNLPDNKGDLNEIVRQGIDLQKPFGQALAVVSKSNCQKKRNGMYPGADEYVNDAYYADHAKFIQEQHNPQLGDLQPEIEAIKAWDVISRGEWQLGTDFNVRASMTEKGGKLLDNLLATDGLMQDYQEARNGGMPNIDMTKRLIKEMNDDEEEGEAQAEQMAADAGADGEPADANADPSGGKPAEGNGSEAGDGQGEEGEGEGKGDLQEGGEDVEDDFRNLDEEGEEVEGTTENSGRQDKPGQ